MSANPDSVRNQGEFHSRVPPSHPMMTGGHQPGHKVGNDAAPEFHAKTYPAGSAPKERTFYPNPIHEIPGQAMNPNADEFGHTGALDSPGATSGEVYNESLSRPVQGQSGHELHSAVHAGKRKKEHGGLAGVGATATTLEGSVEGRAHELRADLPEGVKHGVKGTGLGAEEMNPVSAAQLAAEHRRA